MASTSAKGLFVTACALGIFAAPAWAETAGDRAAAEAILTELGAPSASASASASAGLYARPLGEAKQALERARGARESGDVARAELLEGLAREWAETASDTVRAARAEGEAALVEEKSAQAVVQAERARTLLEESIAHRGEARARLDQMHAASAEPAPPPGAATKKGPKDEAKDAATKKGPKDEAKGAAPNTAGPKGAQPKDTKPTARPKDVPSKDEPVKEAP
jgi:hypothetical protein